MGFALGISVILNIILIIVLVSRKSDTTCQETMKSQEDIKQLVNYKFNLVMEAMKAGFDVTDRNFSKLGRSISKIEKDIFSGGVGRLDSDLKQKQSKKDSYTEDDDDSDERSSVSKSSVPKLTFVDRWIEENVNKSKEFEDNVYKMFKHKPNEMYNDFLDYGMLYKVVKFCKEIETYVYSSFTKEDGEFLKLILKTKDLDMEDLIMVDRMYGLDEYGDEAHLYSYVISNFENHVKMYECYLNVREEVFKECKELVEHNKGLMGPMNFE